MQKKSQIHEAQSMLCAAYVEHLNDAMVKAREQERSERMRASDRDRHRADIDCKQAQFVGVGTQLIKTCIQSEEKTMSFTKYSCTRCGGSGKYSFHLIRGTVCFQCGGSGSKMIDLKNTVARQAAAAARHQSKVARCRFPFNLSLLNLNLALMIP